MIKSPTQNIVEPNVKKTPVSTGFDTSRAHCSLRSGRIGHWRTPDCQSRSTVSLRYDRDPVFLARALLSPCDTNRIENSDYDAVFAHGGCFHFALRLHKRFGYKIRGLRAGHDGNTLSGYTRCLSHSGSHRLNDFRTPLRR